MLLTSRACTLLLATLAALTRLLRNCCKRSSTKGPARASTKGPAGWVSKVNPVHRPQQSSGQHGSDFRKEASVL